jgi:cystathionine gamma-lyase
MAKKVEKRAKSAPKAVSKKAIKKTPKKTPAKAQSAKATPAKAQKADAPVWKAPFHKQIKQWHDVDQYFQMNQHYAKFGDGTRAIHAGNEPGQEWGEVVPPIHMATTYAQDAPGQPHCFDYSRCGNPTRLNFERCLASIEHANYAFATSSGMAAHVTVMGMLQRGDHILCIDDVYGGTQRYLRRILSPNAGVELTIDDFRDIKKFKAMIRPRTKVCWMETPTNPTLKCYDIRKIADALKGTGVILVVDNTFATPINQNPLTLGADIVSHSVTKYIGGHSDVIAGALCFNSKELYDKMFFILKTMGTGLSAFDSWVAIRGIKTLHVRAQRASSNALAIAKLMEGHKKVSRVIYPGLKSHPHYKEHMVNSKTKAGGGMLSFYIKGNAAKFLQSLKIFTLAESLGGVESLAEHPLTMTHGSVPEAHRKHLGIDEKFVRMSVGIEDEADLLADINQALAKA